MAYRNTRPALARGANHQTRTLEAIRERESADARFREAFLAMLRNVRPAPHPAWRWHDVARAKYHPMRVAVEMIDSAIAAGATESDVWGIVTVLASHIESRYPRTVPSLRDASIAETAAESSANPAQLAATLAPDVSTLAVAEERVTSAHRATGRLLESIRHARRTLATACANGGARVWS